MLFFENTNFNFGKHKLCPSHEVMRQDASNSHFKSTSHIPAALTERLIFVLLKITQNLSRNNAVDRRFYDALFGSYSVRSIHGFHLW